MSRQIDLSLSYDDIEYIEKMTKDRKYWKWFRIGKISATTFKYVCRTNLTNPSMHTIKTICYPSAKELTVPAVEYGKKYESVAIEQFRRFQATHGHVNVEITTVGLCTNPEKPYFVSTPDAFYCCDCCRPFIIEVKCPYVLKNNGKIEKLLSMKDPYIKLNDDNKYEVNHKHQYYFQIQMQLYTCQLDRAKFIIWSNEEILILKVERSHEFWIENAIKAEQFFFDIIMPELLGNLNL